MDANQGDSSPLVVDGLIAIISGILTAVGSGLVLFFLFLFSFSWSRGLTSSAADYVQFFTSLLHRSYSTESLAIAAHCTLFTGFYVFLRRREAKLPWFLLATILAAIPSWNEIVPWSTSSQNLTGPILATMFLTIFAVPAWSLIVLSVGSVILHVHPDRTRTGPGSAFHRRQLESLFERTWATVEAEIHPRTAAWKDAWREDKTTIRDRWMKEPYIIWLPTKLPSKSFAPDEYLIYITDDIALTNHHLWISKHPGEWRAAIADCHKYAVEIKDVETIKVDNNAKTVAVALCSGKTYITRMKGPSITPHLIDEVFPVLKREPESVTIFHSRPYCSAKAPSPCTN